MDNQTRQFGVPEEEPRRPRPKQYFPDAAEQARQQPEYPQQPYRDQYQDQQYYDYGQYEQPQYTQPNPPGPPPAPEERSNTLATVLGVLLAIALAAGIVLFFLWRGASAEASKPPVTVTNTQTETITTTATTTKRPSLFGDRDSRDTRDADREEPVPTELPDAPPVEVPEEVRDGAQDIIDELRRGTEGLLQGQ